MVAHPDPSTFQILPWRPGMSGVARMFCDIRTPEGTLFEGDPRAVLRRAITRANDMGLSFYVGPEIEYFLFRDSQTPEPLDVGTYFDLTPLDVGSDFRRRVIDYLEQLGVPVKDSHHAIAASQHEVDLRHTDALTMADSVMTFRLAVKEVAQELGVYATFMPKPHPRASTGRACTRTCRCSRAAATRSSTRRIATTCRRRAGRSWPACCATHARSARSRTNG